MAVNGYISHETVTDQPSENCEPALSPFTFPNTRLVTECQGPVTAPSVFGSFCHVILEKLLGRGIQKPRELGTAVVLLNPKQEAPRSEGSTAGSCPAPPRADVC